MEPTSDEVAKKLEAVEKIIREPVMLEFSQPILKIRTNLIVVSAISIAMTMSGLHIERDSAIFGLKFSGLTDNVLYNGLIAVILYLLVHFIWVAVDNFVEWRLRLTGTRTAFITAAVWASEDADYPKEPRQSSLYNWCYDRNILFKSLADENSIRPRMIVSLKRFDNWFEFFLRSQNLRWLVIDFGVPALLSTCALLLLLTR